jgi:hypothetical protein
MFMARSIRALIAAFGCSVALVASATPARADDVSGDWLFDTTKFEEDCQITGRITFRPTTLSNTYTCLFESEQICGPLNGNLYIKVSQTCTAQRVGKQVAIKSKVVKVLDRKPRVDFPEQYYLADNFVVTLSKNMLEMNGGHYDEQRQLKARFWRDVELMS